MKAFYFPAVILLGILLLSLRAGYRIQQQTELWSEMLAETARLTETAQWGQAEQHLQALCSDWHAHQTALHTVIDHHRLDEAELLLTEAITTCRNRDAAALCGQLVKLQVQMQQLAETQAFTIRNIL